MKRKFDMDLSKFDQQLDLVHQTHIHDIESMKGIHRQFNKASEKFDQKLSIVVDLEKAYQNLLLHMKNTSQVVDSLIQLKLLFSNDNQLMPVESEHLDEISLSPKASASPAEKRKTYNLNPMSFQESNEGIMRINTQISREDEPQTSAHERDATENLRIDSSNNLADFEGMSDYMQGQPSR